MEWKFWKVCSKANFSVCRAGLAVGQGNPFLRPAVMAAAWWVSLVLFGSLVGCGNGLVQIRGRVELDGKPLEGATVTFTQTNGLGRPISGYSDKRGNFRLTTFEPNDGVKPGDYKVSIAKITTAEGLQVESDNPDDVLAKAFHATNPTDPYFANVKRLTPEVYDNPNTTPFVCKVPPEQQPVVFNLDSQVAGAAGEVSPGETSSPQ